MLKIQFPTYNQIDKIKQLNSKYLVSDVTEAKKQNGFVRIEYTQDDLKHIIENNEIVIATLEDTIIGYYLIGRKSCKDTLEYQKNKAISLSSNTEISFSKIGYGCQVCVEEEYRKNGLFGQMLNFLSDKTKDKYTHLLCSVSDHNTVSLKTHITNGWQLIDKVETTMFFIFNTHH